MKRIIKSLLLAVLCISFIVVLFGCKPSNIKQPNTDKNVYTVSFMVEGKVYENQLVNGGGAAVKPFKDPVKKNHNFIGWSTAPIEYKPYNFNVALTENLTLYACFEFNEEAMADDIQELSRSIVKVNHTYKENGEQKQVNGVGFVYMISSNYCFIVTKYHTVFSNEHQTDPVITVTDREGNEMEALVYKNPNKTFPALCEEYNLALICFPYSGTVLTANKYTAGIKKLGDDVIAITSKDEVSAGKVIEYKKPDVIDEAGIPNIDFEVFCHNAIPNSEVNGSILYSLESELLGITYYSKNGIAYTIPNSRIAIFINTYVY